MRAYVFSKWLSKAELREVPVPEPGPGEVLIRMGGAGACHSDLHIMHEWTPETFPPAALMPLPFTLGHENAGWIENGDIPPGLEQGSAVVISPTWSCGVCTSCRIGETNYCEVEALSAGGLGRDGGFADYMVAPAHCLIPLTRIEPWQAAPLTDAGLTSYHAVKRCLPKLTPDTSVVVIGVGGLGHLAIEFLRELSGARIIAVDRDEKALGMAEERGADACLISDESVAGAIRDATKGLGAMAVLDFVGIDSTMLLATQIVRRRGEIVVVGMGGGMLPFQNGVIPYGCSLTYTLGGSTKELVEVVALAESGRIRPHIEKYSLDDIDDVFRRLHDNAISGRAVLVP
jgi:alcohol dehydrogenase, propanol-preferring